MSLNLLVSQRFMFSGCGQLENHAELLGLKWRVLEYDLFFSVILKDKVPFGFCIFKLVTV